MLNVIQTLTNDCHDLGELGSSFANRCPANYLELDECPFNKSCIEIQERDWIKVIKKELDEYPKEE